jgi:hypothetical protein
MRLAAAKKKEIQKKIGERDEATVMASCCGRTS